MICFLKVFKICSLLLLLVNINGTAAATAAGSLRDFKAALMYYAGAYLKGAKIDKTKLEGEVSNYIQRKFISAIQYVENSREGLTEEELQELQRFRASLQAGTDIYEEMAKIFWNFKPIPSVHKHRDNFKTELRTESKKIQDLLQHRLSKGETVILPATWKGHAIILVLKPGEKEKTFDLTVVNTGSGIQFHFQQEDPQNIYPFLTRVWVEFKDIPEKDIFAKDAWFIQGLSLLNIDTFIDNLPKATDDTKNYLPFYFYRSFLANFSEYLVPVEKGKNVQIPMQISGTCSVSCLIGALLYHTKDMKTFELYRLRIGNAFVEMLFNDKPDNEFIHAITDGFGSEGRKFLRILMVSMAQQAVKYLEAVLPNEFKNFGSFGPKKSFWAFRNKTEVFEALKAQPDLLLNLNLTKSLFEKIQEFIKLNEIRKESTQLIVQNRFFENLLFQASPVPNFDGTDLNFEDRSLNLLQSFSGRREIKIKTSNRFFDIFKSISEVLDSKSMYKVFDLFREAHRYDKNWFNSFIANLNDPELLIDIVDTCFEISYDYFRRQKLLSSSFDVIVVLSYMQILTWNSVLRYNELISENSEICKIEFPQGMKPKTLQSVLFGSEMFSILRADCVKWSINNVFDPRSYEMFNVAIKAMGTFGNSDSPPYFAGPEAFVDIFSLFIKNESLFSKLETGSEKMPYLSMMKHPIVEKKLKEMKLNSKGPSKDINFKDKLSFSGPELDPKTKSDHQSDEDKKLYILLVDGRDDLRSVFPHFYKLMNTLSIIQVAAFNTDKRMITSEKDWISQSKLKKDGFLNFDFVILGLSPQSSFGRTSGCEASTFYLSRHCSAFAADIDAVNIDSWLNNVKMAKSAKIFDSSEFQYISDHLLNVPKYLGTTEIFPIDTPRAEVIVSELMRLIGISLNKLYDKSNFPKSEKATKLIQRTTNISVIMTRFIARLDYKKIVSGNFCAKSLAKLYNMMLPFAPLESNYPLADEDISRINMTLFHICSVPIRNSLTFMQNTKWKEEFNGDMYRKTLERYHWFAAKFNYYIVGYGTNILDDQFFYEMPMSNITASETKFFEEILKKLCLPFYTKNSVSNFSFAYANGGSIVEINSMDLDDFKLFLNISSASASLNYMMVSQKNVFTNSALFSEFFSRDEQQLAKNGITVQYEDSMAYYLPDFKGKNYLMIRNKQNDSESFYMLRKYQDSWYIWTETGHCQELTEKVKYKWLNSAKIFKRELKKPRKTIFDDVKPPMRYFGVEMLVFSGDDKEPLLTLSVSDGYEYDDEHFVKIAIRGFNSGNNFGWNLIKHDNENFDFERHILAFVEDDFIAAQHDDRRLVAIFPGYRLPEDPERPLVLMEKDAGTSASEYLVLNSPGLVICADQALNGGTSLPGGLVVMFDGSKKTLLLPHVEKFNRIKEDLINSRQCSFDNYYKLEKIPIIDGKPTPSTRFHKLLLAYYAILAHDYIPALSLLDPSKSLHQNEVFSLQELEIMNWIMSIDTNAPEALSLKMIVGINSAINQSKYQLDYEEKDRSEMINLIIKEAQMTSISYLFVVNELTEQNHVHRIFPEILNNDIFKSIFANPQNAKVKYTVIGRSKTNIKPFERTSAVKFDHKWGQILNNGNFEFYASLPENYDQVSTLGRLVHRETVNKILVSEPEFMLYCFSKYDNLFDQFKKKTSNFKTIFDKCKESCFDNFRGIDQSISSKATVLENIKLAMQKEMTKYQIKKPENPFKLELDFIGLVNENDIEILGSIKNELQPIIKKPHNSSETLVTFETGPLNSSHVLKNLEKAISNFVNENGINTITEVNLANHEGILDALKTLNLFIEARINELVNEQNLAASELICMTQTEYQSVFSLIDLMHDRKKQTFSSLYKCYFKDSLACIQAKFPQLDIESCKTLKQMANVFFSRKILIDYLIMLNGHSEIFIKLSRKALPVSVDDLLIFRNELGKIEDFNERMQSPAIMNFEFRSGKYRLTKEQLKDVTALVSYEDGTKEKFNSVVLQRMMAAGKTLVLGTISIVTKALDQAKISILVPPSSLYQSNTTDMQTRTYQYFKKTGKTFIFPRFPRSYFTSTDLHLNMRKSLETTIEIIENSMKYQNYLILGPETLHSFLNSYIEVLSSLKNGWYTVYEALKLYAKIYHLFKTRGSIILDEIDMTMDPKKELNFPTDATESYNMLAVKLLANIFEFILYDKDIIKSGLDIYSNNQASLTHAGYEKCCDLILNYIESQINDTSSMWNSRLITNDDDVGEIMSFLRNPDMTSGKEWITGYHESGNKVAAEALIIIKSQIYQFMEDSLKGTVNLTFGSAGSLRPEIKYAVPYVAANTPSANSVFADRWETLLKTLLMISSSPCSESLTKDIIQYLKNNMLEESYPSTPIESTPTFNTVRLILPANLSPTDLNGNNIDHVRNFYASLKIRSPAAIKILFSYYMNKVFAEMTFPVEQITSNALNVTDMFASVQGYSGTIDNVNILPQRVIKNAYQDHENNEKNNGGIALKLVRDFNNASVPVLNNDILSNPVIEDLVREILGFYDKDSENISAIIDTGAFFKNFKNREVAKAIAEVCNGKVEVVLYYDEDSNQLEFIRPLNDTRGYLDKTDPEYITKSTQADISSRFTFYDQRHITGSDILQPKSAHAIMTISTRVLLRDILQGTLRMRQFMTSQKVHLIATEAAKTFYYSKIGNHTESFKISDILTLGALNEEDKQAQENQKLAFAKIDSEIRSFALDEMSRLIMEKDKDYYSQSTRICQLFDCARDIFIRSSREEPLQWLQEKKPEPTEKVLKTYAISRLMPFNSLMAKLDSDSPIIKKFNSMKKRIKNMIEPFEKDEKSKHTDSLLHYLKDEINSHINSQMGTEVQQQVLTLTLVDVNLDTIIDSNDMKPKPRTYQYNLLEELNKDADGETLNPGFVYDFLKDEKQAPPYISLQILYDHPKKSYKHKDIINKVLISSGTRVGVTLDLVSTDETNSLPIFSKNTREGSHLLVQTSKTFTNVKVLLVSQKHAHTILKELNDASENPITSSSYFWICDLSGSVTATNHSATQAHENIITVIPGIETLIFEALVLNGSLSQILGNFPDIYKSWLGCEYFKERATFLLIRMKVLFGKFDEMFDKDDSEIIELRILANGKKKLASRPEKDAANNFKAELLRLSEERFAEKMGLAFPKPDLVIAEKLVKCTSFDIKRELERIYQTGGVPGKQETFELDRSSLDKSIVIPRDEDFAKSPEARTGPIICKPPSFNDIFNYQKEQSNSSTDLRKVKLQLDSEINVPESFEEFKEPALEAYSNPFEKDITTMNEENIQNSKK